MASEPRSRRFLPGDPRVEEPYRLTPQLALRVAILGFVALAVFAVLFLRLWALQVLSGTKYRAEASHEPRPDDPGRRAARARSSTATADRSSTNVLGTSLEVWPADLPKSRRRAATPSSRALSMVAGDPGQGDPREDQAARRRPADAGRPPARDPQRPVRLPRGAPASSSPASSSPTRYLRSYPYKSLARAGARLRRPDHASRAEGGRSSAGYQPQDVMGQAGIEQSYDRYLKGKDGSDSAHRRLARPADEPDPGRRCSRSRATRCG